MSCPHSLIGSPESCSQCLGAQPRRVVSNGDELLIDGVPTGRTLDRETTDARVQYGRRGGRVQRRSGAL